MKSGFSPIDGRLLDGSCFIESAALRSLIFEVGKYRAASEVPVTSHRYRKVLLPCVSLLFLSSFPSFAATYRQVDLPGSTATVIYGINSAGQMVGQYLTATGGSGFVLSKGTFTNINYPGTTGDTDTGINDHGDIVGYYYTDAVHSFLYQNGQFTSIAYPGASSTQVNGINNLGDVVGAYADETGWHGFLLHEGVFTSFDVPGGDFTSAFGINDEESFQDTFTHTVTTIATSSRTSCSMRGKLLPALPQPKRMGSTI